MCKSSVLRSEVRPDSREGKYDRRLVYKTLVPKYVGKRSKEMVDYGVERFIKGWNVIKITSALLKMMEENF